MTEVDCFRIPNPEPISLRNTPLENIRYFKHQWMYYCIAYDLDRLPNKKKIATFFMLIGREAFDYVTQKLKLSDEEMNDCDKILAALENSHKPSTNVIYQRFLFNETVQDDADTIDEFVDKLRKLAEQCEFKERTEEMIRDRFIVGLKNKEVQKELLTQTELNLTEAVRFSKNKDLERESNVRTLYQKVNSALELPDKAHSTTAPVAVPSSSPSSIKLEKIDDDDLIILNHCRGDSDIVAVTSSNRPLKRVKLEVERNVNDNEKSNAQTVEAGNVAGSADSSNTNMSVGSFVVLKDNWNNMVHPPIWRVDSVALLQKFIPIEYNGITLYKSTAVYSGWSLAVRDQYYIAPVKMRNEQSNRKETIVELQIDALPIKMQIEKINGLSREKSS